MKCFAKFVNAYNHFRKTLHLIYLKGSKYAFGGAELVNLTSVLAYSASYTNGSTNDAIYLEYFHILILNSKIFSVPKYYLPGYYLLSAKDKYCFRVGFDKISNDSVYSEKYKISWSIRCHVLSRRV